MVMVGEQGNTYYMDKILKQNIDVQIDAMADNDDLVFVIDGPERAGKSKLARHIGKYCALKLNTEFDDKNVHFELQKYLDFSLESSNYTVCVLDEARNVLNKKSSTSKVNKKFTNYISECAKKRQVHIICIPAFHDLDKYITLWRMKWVVNVHKWFEEDSAKDSGFRLARGQYTLFMNDDALKLKYQYPYQYPYKHFETKGQFKDFEVFTPQQLTDYENKKDDNMVLKYHSKSEEEQLSKRELMWKARTLKLVDHCEKNRGLTRGELADALGMETNTLNKTISYEKDK